MAKIMANVLILNGPRDPREVRTPEYRGSYRKHPTFVESLPSDDEVNVLFLWFLKEGGELGVVHDVRKALKYADLLNKKPKLSQLDEFQVVEVTQGSTVPQFSGEFLGIDLSSGYNYSLLSWWGKEPIIPSGLLPASIRELGNLIYRCYGPQRNTHGLFDDLSVATDCLRAMDALQQLSPNLYEGENLIPNFEPIGLYAISSATIL